MDGLSNIFENFYRLRPAARGPGWAGGGQQNQSSQRPDIATEIQCKAFLEKWPRLAILLSEALFIRENPGSRKGFWEGGFT